MQCREYRKKSYVLCCACCTASATQHVTTSAASAIGPSPRARYRRGTQLSLFVMCIKLWSPQFVSINEIISFVTWNNKYSSNKTWYRFTRELYCFVVRRAIIGTYATDASTAQHARHNMSRQWRHVTTRTTRRACRVVMCRDATSGIWAITFEIFVAPCP